MKSATRILVPGLLLCLAVIAGSPAAAHPGIDEQIRDLNQRIHDNPKEATLFLRRGELHRIHRDWKKAEADYKRARRLDPQLTVVDQRLGRLHLEAGQADKAVKELQRYVEKRPNEVDALVTLGRALAAVGRHLDAADAFTRALAAVRNGQPRPEYYLERAKSLKAAGPDHISRALDGLDEGLAVLGQPVTLQLFAIELELSGRRFDAALARLDRIAAQSARQETWLVRRGEILEVAGRYDEARAAYGKTLEAIEALPTSRRSNRAVARLEQQARGALERLAQKDKPQAPAAVEGDDRP